MATWCKCKLLAPITNHVFRGQLGATNQIQDYDTCVQVTILEYANFKVRVTMVTKLPKKRRLAYMLKNTFIQKLQVPSFD